MIVNILGEVCGSGLSVRDWASLNEPLVLASGPSACEPEQVYILQCSGKPTEPARDLLCPWCSLWFCVHSQFDVIFPFSFCFHSILFTQYFLPVAYFYTLLGFFIGLD